MEFTEGAACRGGCCKAARPVEGYGADGAMSNVLDVVAGYADGQGVIVRWINYFAKPIRAGEFQRARSRQHYVRRLFHHTACDLNRADEVTQSRDGTGLSGPAVHDRCVELNVAGAVGGRTATGNVQPTGL